MSDPIRLSLWFSTQTTAQILPRLSSVIEILPAEALERGVRQITVVPLEWSEPPLLDERFDTGIPLSGALEQMREFVQEDCACELELAWLLWIYGSNGWEQIPQPVRFTGFGPSFGEGLAKEEGHVVVDFGLDEAFLAELAPWDTATRRHLEANILQLLAYSHRLQQQLHPVKRRLWSEEEDDWSQKLLARMGE